MNHFPIFLAVTGQKIIVAGGGEAALAKLRLLLKTTAKITVITPMPDTQIESWARAGKLSLIGRPMMKGDAVAAALFYAASEDAQEDARTAKIAADEGALVNIVDNLQDSAFITPAIVDRDPVTIAIGTEGAAPVLARAIKQDLESRLPVSLGPLARAGQAFRKMAEKLPHGAARRNFWRDYYFNVGPRAISHGEDAAHESLDALLLQHLAAAPDQGHVDFVGAGPGDPELLTLKARKALDRADIVIYDAAIPPTVLELARREAILIKSRTRDPGAARDVNLAMVNNANKGAHVVRLLEGDLQNIAAYKPAIEAVRSADLSFAIIPGVAAQPKTAATPGKTTWPAVTFWPRRPASQSAANDTRFQEAH